MTVYASEDDCKSALGKRMQSFRADRPSEWLMDEFIYEAEQLYQQLTEAQAEIERLEAAQDKLRGQLQNAINHLSGAKRKYTSLERYCSPSIESGNKALYETLHADKLESE